MSIFDKFELIETCGACPEQYDVLDLEGNIVAYFRLRHGSFTVTCPDVGGELVYYSTNPEGDGMFEVHEREKYLRKALKKVKKWQNRSVA